MSGLQDLRQVSGSQESSGFERLAGVRWMLFLWVFGVAFCSYPVQAAPPVVSPIGNKSVCAGGTLTFGILATDADMGALTFSMMGAPAGAALNPFTGMLTWAPSPSQLGAHAVTFTVTDPTLLKDEETITITVSNCTLTNCLVLFCPTNMSNLVIAGHSPEGTTFHFTVDATNHCSQGQVVVICNPPSGSQFPPGVTEVACAAHDGDLTNSCSFTVTVRGTSANASPFCTGRLLDEVGRPLAGVSVNLIGATTQTTFTDGQGQFIFTGLASGSNYVIQPFKQHFGFAPQEQAFRASNGPVVVYFTGQTPFRSWQLQHWGTNTAVSLVAPAADWDGDGIPNLIEYAFGYDPTMAQKQTPLRAVYDSSNSPPHLTLEFQPVDHAVDLGFGIEVTGDLQSGIWTSAGEDIVLADLPCPPLLCPISISFPVIDHRARFYRLRLRPLYPVDPPGDGTAPPEAEVESLRVGFFDVRVLNPLALFFMRPPCDWIADRPRKIAHAIEANLENLDVIALAGAFSNGEDPCGFGFAPRGGEIKTYLQEVLGPTSMDMIEQLAAGDTATCETVFPLLRRAAGYGNAKGDLVEVLQRHYPYFVKFLDGDGYNFDDSGLMIFSRLPFESLPESVPVPSESAVEVYARGLRSAPRDRHVAFTKFDQATGWDRFTAKGVGLVRLRNEGTGRHYTVVFTQLDEGNLPDVRAMQLLQIQTLIATHLDGLPVGERDAESVLLLGGLSINGDLKQHYDSSGVVTPALREWHDLLGTPGGYFTDVLRDAWAAQCNPLVVALPYMDSGLTANLAGEPGGGARRDYILMNTPSVAYRNQPLCIQHMALAYCLNDDPLTGEVVAFGRAGRDRLSDHYGVIADINICTEGCSPQNARRAVLDGSPIPGELVHPGSMQWYRVDMDGTYTFAVRADSLPGAELVVEVFDSRELSRPLAPAGSRLVDSSIGQVRGAVFRSSEAPLFLRVSRRGRGGRGGYNLVALRHQGFSKDDAIALGPNTRLREVETSHGLELAPRWFKLKIERTTARTQQHLIFQKQDTGSVVQHHQLLLLDEDLFPVPGAMGEGMGIIDFGLDLVGGSIDGVQPVGDYYLVVTPLSPTTETYVIGWSTDLTVLFGASTSFGDSILKCLQTDDPEVCFVFCFDGDDELTWSTIGVKARSDPPWGGTIVGTRSCWTRFFGYCMARYESVEPGDYFGLDMEPIRFTPVQSAVFWLKENDDLGAPDYMVGEIEALPRDHQEDLVDAHLDATCYPDDLCSGLRGRYLLRTIRAHSSFR